MSEAAGIYNHESVDSAGPPEPMDIIVQKTYEQSYLQHVYQYTSFAYRVMRVCKEESREGRSPWSAASKTSGYRPTR